MSKQVKIIGIDYGLTQREYRRACPSILNEIIVSDIMTSVARTYDTELPNYCFNDNDIICILGELENNREVDVSEINQILQKETRKNIIVLGWKNKNYITSTALIDDSYKEKIDNIVNGVYNEYNTILLIQNLIDKDVDTSIKEVFCKDED